MSTFGQNLANTLIHNSFSLEQTAAAERQRAMAAAAAFLEAKMPGSSVKPTTNQETAMIPAALRGLFYHRQGDGENAASWYTLAAQVEPLPEIQQQILISPWMELETTGDFILAASNKGWQIRSDTKPGSRLMKTDAGTVVFSCAEIQGAAKKAILEWKESFSIPYHHTLILRANTAIGTTLNLETVIDGQIIRHLAHSGSGHWQEFEIPVAGNDVKYIYLIIREDKDAPRKSCQAEIDSITFLLDETLVDDHSG